MCDDFVRVPKQRNKYSTRQTVTVSYVALGRTSAGDNNAHRSSENNICRTNEMLLCQTKIQVNYYYYIRSEVLNVLHTDG